MKKLPPRDVFIGGTPAGWRPSTLDRADRGLDAEMALSAPERE